VDASRSVNIPDCISPIVGYRVWRWDAAGLRSLNGEPWPPGRALPAACGGTARVPIFGHAEAVRGAHAAPHSDCTCGVYAAKNIEHLRTTGYWQYGIYGEVNLWGTVVEHKLGWRAQFAYPKSLFLLPDALPFKLAEIQSRLKMLTTYRIDVFIADPKGDIPLSGKDSGFDPAGLDYIIRMSNEYYDRRREKRTLKKGDRVAVLGRGIAVVEKIDHNQVHVLLRNTYALRVPRNHVVWDQQNRRWECEAILEEY
jgi:hypothetical protein